MSDMKRALPRATADAREISFHDDVSTNATVGALNQARDRLDKSIRLLTWSLDLRELLWLGLDLNDMRDEVAAIKRAAQSHMRRAP
jgi:hypothetical protein